MLKAKERTLDDVLVVEDGSVNSNEMDDGGWALRLRMMRWRMEGRKWK